MDQNKRLERDSENKVLGGVCSGLADFFNLDVALVRIFFVIALLFASFGFWLYVVLWIVLPVEGQQSTVNSQQTSSTEQQPTAHSQQLSPSSKKTSIFAGVAVIFIGLIFLVNNFLPISWIWKLWPLILVAIGVVMILNATKKGGDDE